MFSMTLHPAVPYDPNGTDLALIREVIGTCNSGEERGAGGHRYLSSDLALIRDVISTCSTR